MLVAACDKVGIDAGNAEPIRFGENAIYRLPGQHIVVRVARAGPAAWATAVKEVEVSGWLASHEVDAVRAVDGLPQAVEVEGRVVTFWEELPPHHYGSYPEIATALRRLHSLPAPIGLALDELAPFAHLAERLDASTSLPADDRGWLNNRLIDLQQRYAKGLPPGLPVSVVHGDASAGNVVAADDGRVFLLDLERFSIGPLEWDLVSTAIDYTTFGILDRPGYDEFCRIYGTDVIEWDGFELLRDARELRITCWMAQLAQDNPEAQAEAALRIACLRDKHGPRPWPWKAIF